MRALREIVDDAAGDEKHERSRKRIGGDVNRESPRVLRIGEDRDKNRYQADDAHQHRENVKYIDACRAFIFPRFGGFHGSYSLVKTASAFFVLLGRRTSRPVFEFGRVAR